MNRVSGAGCRCEKRGDVSRKGGLKEASQSVNATPKNRAATLQIGRERVNRA